MYRDIPDDLRSLIEPVIADASCELVDIEIRNHAADAMIRIIIDNEQGDGRVSIACCQEISREVEASLDATDYMPGRYRLEVTSPGLDRTLAREKDFIAARGSEVKIRTRRPVGERRKFRGLLVDFEAGIASVRVDEQNVEIPFDEVEKANSIYQFSRDDFAGKRPGVASE
jgi:ribosome maturation factor RimP